MYPIMPMQTEQSIQNLLTNIRNIRLPQRPSVLQNQIRQASLHQLDNNPNIAIKLIRFIIAQNIRVLAELHQRDFVNDLIPLSFILGANFFQCITFLSGVILTYINAAGAPFSYCTDYSVL